jgi:hypothetical protein
MKSRMLRLVPLVLILAGSALAHCDTVDGPVVTAARQALEKGDVSLVLHWVQKQDEAEVRRAFAEATAVRKLNAQSRELADRYFFETLVRVHRAGEGAPYTGLKPAGSGVDPGVALADKAIDSGEITRLTQAFAHHMEAGLKERFARVAAARNFRLGDAEAGRAYVAAYVEFIHYAEALHQAIAAEGHAH